MFASDRLTIGTFASAEIAARAYDQRAVELFGEFAWQNFEDRTASMRQVELAAEQRARHDLETIPF